jgi:aryl-alcohol dehydrogenase-like predicted oxidoreductase
MFRQRPAELLFKECLRRKVGILARVPLASGLLTGKLTQKQQFESDDHRSFNRHGEAFDRGETFSGIDYDLGLAAVDALRPLVPRGATLAQWALRWVLMEEAVTCAIPGVRRASQVEDNLAAGELDELSPDVMRKVRQIYTDQIKPKVHQLW